MFGPGLRLSFSFYLFVLCSGFCPRLAVYFGARPFGGCVRVPVSFRLCPWCALWGSSFQFLVPLASGVRPLCALRGWRGGVAAGGPVGSRGFGFGLPCRRGVCLRISLGPLCFT